MQHTYSFAGEDAGARQSPEKQESWSSPHGPKIVAACCVSYLYPRPEEENEDKGQNGPQTLPSFMEVSPRQEDRPPSDTCQCHSGHGVFTRSLGA